MANTSTLTYTFNTTVLPRLLSVSNPAEKVLIAHFNMGMRHDAAFMAPENWHVTGVTPGASELDIIGVRASAGHPNQALLSYSGGINTAIYNLRVVGVVSSSGDPIDPLHDNADFELVYQVEADPGVKLFNSVFGPIGITQRPLTRRTVDKLVTSRSIALGLDVQMQLRLQSFDNGTAGRDGRPGIRRT